MRQGDPHKSDLRPLPLGKSVVQVFADFLCYLYKCAKTYITESHPNGESLWHSFGERIEIILTHPNGWEGAQQGEMRKAAILAGLVPDTTAGHSRIHFVTEGEASLHFCVNGGLAANLFRVSGTLCLFWRLVLNRDPQDHVNLTVVDAGGGTIDVSSYTCVSMSPISVEEIAPTGCK